jgi:hypothetical protein
VEDYCLLEGTTITYSMAPRVGFPSTTVYAGEGY